jgi:threonine 3-dehydrogenase
MTDMIEARLEVADRLSGGMVIDIKRANAVAKILDLTNGKGADFVVEAAATQSALDQAFELVKTRGTIVTIGTFDRPVTFNPFFTMTRREIKLLSTMGRTWQTWRRMVQLIESDKLNLKPFISHILPLEAYQEGFELVKTNEVMKVLLQP